MNIWCLDALVTIDFPPAPSYRLPAPKITARHLSTATLQQAHSYLSPGLTMTQAALGSLSRLSLFFVPTKP